MGTEDFHSSTNARIRFKTLNRVGRLFKKFGPVKWSQECSSIIQHKVTCDLCVVRISSRKKQISLIAHQGGFIFKRHGNISTYDLKIVRKIGRILDIESGKIKPWWKRAYSFIAKPDFSVPLIKTILSYGLKIAGTIALAGLLALSERVPIISRMVDSLTEKIAAQPNMRHGRNYRRPSNSKDSLEK